ncbi:hypothetical protein EJD97_019582, partial [Solanum chilense]
RVQSNIKPSIDNKKSNLITSASLSFSFFNIGFKMFPYDISRASHFAASFCESISFFIFFSPSFTLHRKAFTTER